MDNPLNHHTREARTMGRAEGRSPYLLWLIWALWLPLVIPALIIFFQSHPALPRLILTLVGLILFFVLYLWCAWLRAQSLGSGPTTTRDRHAWTWPVIVSLGILSLALTLIGGNEWLALFFYTSGFIGGCLTTRQALVVALCFTLCVVILGRFIGLSWLALLQAVVFIPTIVCITRSVIWSITTSWELRAAREEIARLAVVNERLRIARDLHDLLGHNLSLIALKSELAGRLLNAAPERASREIHDIETVARTTLQEVREAVTSYRQPTLASELYAAQELLSAAGVAYHDESGENDRSVLDDLPSGIEAVLAWTIREGVTNVIKHSRAQQCWLKITRDRQQVGVEINDDGTASSATDLHEGNGLRGLRERITALGGHVDIRSHIGSGFSLRVCIPLVRKRSGVAQDDHAASIEERRSEQ